MFPTEYRGFVIARVLRRRVDDDRPHTNFFPAIERVLAVYLPRLQPESVYGFRPPAILPRQALVYSLRCFSNVRDGTGKTAVRMYVYLRHPVT